MAINPHTKSRIAHDAWPEADVRLGVRVKNTQKGFALLIAVIFMSVMLALGLALGSLAYKQTVLSSNAVESQYAFYAADAGLECALYADRHDASFIPYPANSQSAVAPPINCDGVSINPEPDQAGSWNANRWIIKYRIPLDSLMPNPRCADVTVYKYDKPTPKTYIFSQGYDVSCSDVGAVARFVSRGLNTHY
ncbi:MAG: hypothetical protein WCW36_01110 [Candidatus Paceibacterota bacterium]|jgi:hypothetical protein